MRNITRNFFDSVFLTPSSCGHSPYIPYRKHRGRGLKVVFQFRYKDTLCTSPLCFVAQNIGEKQRSDSDEEGDWKDSIPRIV